LFNEHLRRSVLVLDSILNIDTLSIMLSFSKSNKKEFLNTTLMIIDILVKSLLLEDKRNLDIIYERLTSFLESEFANPKLKELLNIMISELGAVAKYVKTPQDSR